MAALLKQIALLQQLVDESKRGRVMSLFQVAWAGLVPFGGLGMGAVFIILCALIVIITLVSKLVPEEASAPPAAPRPQAVDPAHVAAISAAVRMHRNKNR